MEDGDEKNRYQIAALMMSVIIATGSLSGPVFAAETSGDTTESSVVEEIEESEQSEAEDEKADEGSENESEQETEEPAEDSSQETEESVEDTQNLDEKEEDHNQSVPEEIESNTEEEKTDSSSDTIDTPTEETDTMETSEEGKEDNQSVTTTLSEQETFSADSMNTELLTDEDVVDSGSCGNNATWVLTGTDNNLALTIGGSGAMDNFSEDNIPWASKRAKIKRCRRWDYPYR